MTTSQARQSKASLPSQRQIPAAKRHQAQGSLRRKGTAATKAQLLP